MTDGDLTTATALIRCWLAAAEPNVQTPLLLLEGRSRSRSAARGRPSSRLGEPWAQSAVSDEAPPLEWLRGCRLLITRAQPSADARELAGRRCAAQRGAWLDLRAPILLDSRHRRAATADETLRAAGFAFIKQRQTARRPAGAGARSKHAFAVSASAWRRRVRVCLSPCRSRDRG